tara:strand:- start:1119 stop:1346 length:228 start_codon:yes stop_codon:yes gene_type:complete
MSGNQVAAPRLPEAPEEYTRSYMSDLIRTLEIFIEQERNPGEIRATSVTITDLPTSATGLEAGTLYNDAGTVKVA